MSDINYISYADVDGITLEGETISPPNPHMWDDVLKFSHATNCQVTNCVVMGGRENAVDMNRFCQNITLKNCTLDGGEQAGLVIKGGSKDITLNNVFFKNQTGWCDILIGDWSDQSWDKTERVSLTEVDGEKPVRIVVGRGDWPRTTGGSVKILYVASAALKLYWWSKYFWTRFILGKKNLIIP